VLGVEVGTNRGAIPRIHRYPPHEHKILISRKCVWAGRIATYRSSKRAGPSEL